MVGRGDALAEAGGLAVDLDAADGDQSLRLAPRRGGSAPGEEGLETHLYPPSELRVSSRRPLSRPPMRSRTREISWGSTTSSRAGKSLRSPAPAARRKS